MIKKVALLGLVLMCGGCNILQALTTQLTVGALSPLKFPTDLILGLINKVIPGAPINL
jgi:hypothetical protein